MNCLGDKFSQFTLIPTDKEDKRKFREFRTFDIYEMFKFMIVISCVY